MKIIEIYKNSIRSILSSILRFNLKGKIRPLDLFLCERSIPAWKKVLISIRSSTFFANSQWFIAKSVLVPILIIKTFFSDGSACSLFIHVSPENLYHKFFIEWQPPLDYNVYSLFAILCCFHRDKQQRRRNIIKDVCQRILRTCLLQINFGFFIM